MEVMKKERNNRTINNFHSTAGRLPTAFGFFRKTKQKKALDSYIENASEKWWITVTFWQAAEQAS